MSEPVGLHVPEQSERELGRRRTDAVDLLELLLEVGQVQIVRGCSPVPPRETAWLMTIDLGHACLDGRGGVMQVDEE